MRIYILISILLFFTVPNQVLSQDIDSLLLQLSDKKNDKGSICYKIGTEYCNVAAYDLAIENYNKSLEAFEKKQDKHGTAKAFKAIGSVYMIYRNDFEQAINYYLNALRIAESLNDTSICASLYNNLGICYGRLKEFEKARTNYLKSYNYRMAMNDTGSIKIIISNLGELYFYQNKDIEAFDYLMESLRLSKNDDWGISYTYLNIAKYYIDKEKLKQATQFLDSSIEISLHNKYQTLIKYGYYLYTRVYAKQNKVDLLDKYSSLYLSISDSIYNEKSLGILLEMQTKYETKEKEKENDLLRIEKKLQAQKITIQGQKIYSLIIIVLLIFISSIIFFFQYKKQKKANQMLVKKNLEIVERERELKEANIKLENTVVELKENNQLEDPDKEKKYSSSNLQDEQKEHLANLIIDLMQKESLYLNPNFTLQEMADKINTSRTYVSQVINEHFHCNFKSFINEYRIKEARRRLSDPVNRNITIEAIANDVGFKSRSAFIGAFKQFSGVTPSYYVKSIY